MAQVVAHSATGNRAGTPRHAIEAIQQFAASHGPFHALCGFSQATSCSVNRAFLTHLGYVLSVEGAQMVAVVLALLEKNRIALPGVHAGHASHAVHNMQLHMA